MIVLTEIIQTFCMIHKSTKTNVLLNDTCYWCNQVLTHSYFKQLISIYYEVVQKEQHYEAKKTSTFRPANLSFNSLICSWTRGTTSALMKRSESIPIGN